MLVTPPFFLVPSFPPLFMRRRSGELMARLMLVNASFLSSGRWKILPTNTFQFDLEFSFHFFPLEMTFFLGVSICDRFVFFSSLCISFFFFERNNLGLRMSSSFLSSPWPPVYLLFLPVLVAPSLQHGKPSELPFPLPAPLSLFILTEYLAISALEMRKLQRSA